MPPQHTITITVRRAGKDRRGNPTAASTHQVSGCFTAPASGDSGQSASRERTDMRDTVITGHTLYAPFDADILATDEVLVPGDPKWWQVDGEVGPWRSPFSNWKPGLQVALRRVRG